MYERDAADQGIKVDTYFRALKDVDRAIADGEEEGFVKIHTEKGKDKILGATIVASHAGEMINEITLAMVGNLGPENNFWRNSSVPDPGGSNQTGSGHV